MEPLICVFKASQVGEAIRELKERFPGRHFKYLPESIAGGTGGNCPVLTFFAITDE